MLTVQDQACIGVYADREALPDVDRLAEDIDEAISELLAGTYRVMEPGGSLLGRILAIPPEPLEADGHGTSPPPADEIDTQEYEYELQRLADGQDGPANDQPRRFTVAPAASADPPTDA